jgi:hypothetical protein
MEIVREALSFLINLRCCAWWFAHGGRRGTHAPARVAG